jgi:dTDP-4-dehydrorhamnose reductase
MRILIQGASGMLGQSLYRSLRKDPAARVYATTRSRAGLPNWLKADRQVLDGVLADNFDTVLRAFLLARPDVVLNCIGIIKQLDAAKDPIVSISINSLFPHRLSELCSCARVRLIHFSTDCVFSGSKGNYTEADVPDATDLYGRTKLLGEIVSTSALTIRTSIIGHSLGGGPSLIDWFLSQEKEVRGYAHAVYTGLPTVEIGEVLSKVIIPDPSLSGLYHLSSKPISKCELLHLVAVQYGKQIPIVEDVSVRIDRSLDSQRFSAQTGYSAPDWNTLVEKMFRDYEELVHLRRNP